MNEISKMILLSCKNATVFHLLCFLCAADRKARVNGVHSATTVTYSQLNAHKHRCVLLLQCYASIRTVQERVNRVHCCSTPIRARSHTDVYGCYSATHQKRIVLQCSPAVAKTPNLICVNISKVKHSTSNGWRWCDSQRRKNHEIRKHIGQVSMDGWELGTDK